MINVVIIGAGIGGLYTANALIVKGVHPQNILIIDPRAGCYTRPGHLSVPAFSMVYGDFLIPISFSKAKHIKELERGMYAHLCSLNVRFVRETFIDLQPQSRKRKSQLMTIKEDGTIKHYSSVSYVFDCSGTQAVVTRAVNRYHHQFGMLPPFTRSPLVAKNPIPHHLIAHIVVPNLLPYEIMNYVGEDALNGVPFILSIDSFEKQIKIIDQLKAFGWHYSAFPTFYYFKEKVKDKICSYMEAPPNLPKEKQREWISFLLAVYSQGRITEYQEIKPSVKYGTKPRIVYFKNKLYVLNRAIFAAPNWPTVIVGFDGLKGFDYRHASGAVSGMLCCKRMLEYITIQHGTIQKIDQNAIEIAISDFITNQYRNELIQCIGYRQKALEKGYSYFLAMEQIKGTFFSKEEELPQAQEAIAYIAPDIIDSQRLSNQVSVIDTMPHTKKHPPQKPIALPLKSIGLFRDQTSLVPQDSKTSSLWIALLPPLVLTLSCFLWLYLNSRGSSSCGLSAGSRNLATAMDPADKPRDVGGSFLNIPREFR